MLPLSESAIACLSQLFSIPSPSTRITLMRDFLHVPMRVTTVY